MNESQTRLEKIDPKLYNAGWGVVVDSRILTEQNAYTITPGKVGAKSRKPKKIDYLLVYRGVKLAIIEAKRDELSVSEGVMQAKEYAAMMHIRYTYSTNGDEIYFIDMETGEEKDVDNFPSPEELWILTFGSTIEKWKEKFLTEPFDTRHKTPRYYQENAINSAMNAIADGHNRILLTLATGTGKTFIAFQIAWKLYQTRWNLSKSNLRPKILFLADRNILANQALNDFGGFDETAMTRIKPKLVAQKGLPTGRNIYFTIFQTFMSGDKPNFYGYAPDFFDLIIIDECHRGGANDESNWRSILDYFKPAVQLGLTATPKRKDNTDTYNYFGKPVYTYSLKQGIDDGFLTPFRHCRMQSNIDDYIYSPDDDILSGEIEEGKVYNESDFYSGRIEIKQRDEARVAEVMKYIGANEKTIVFCATQNHAGQVRDMINRLKKVKSPNYCVRVTSNDKTQGETYLKEFQDNDKMIPTILTTSQKLSTGVDARNVRNIVLMRPINSIIEFKQIVGRGTRLFDGKNYFTVFDFVRAYERFNDPDWDGEPVCPNCGQVDCECEGGGDVVKPKLVCPICGMRPCECPSEPTICEVCGCSPCICPPKPKLKIKLSDGRVRQIKHIKTDMFYGSGGKPIAVSEFLETMFGEMPKFFSSEEELKKKWSNPATRNKLLYELDKSGYSEEVLRNVQSVIEAEDCDLLDVLEYIAYSVEPIKRKKRVDSRKEAIFDGLTKKQEEFVEFIILKYISTGVSELAMEKLPTLLQMKYGTAGDAVKILGNPAMIQQTFISFQQNLYVM
ncbi:MAG: DEAD/DEAH box helicase family protein [Muribaculaceae bacterium]